MATYPTLREAIAARMIEWDGQSSRDLPLSFYGNELAGEVGEACNVIKKLDRERFGMVGSRATTEQLADELADALICIRRLEVRLGLDLDTTVSSKFNATSAANGLKTRVADG